jgi:hypothetical protein
MDSSTRERSPAAPPPVRIAVAVEASPMPPATPPPLPVVARSQMPPLPVVARSQMPPLPVVARSQMPPLPVASTNPVRAMPPLPSAEPPAFALPVVVAKPVAFPQPLAMPAPSRVYLSDDLPDLLDGRARNRRALFVVIAIALLALLGTIAAAIASHYRPM